MTNLLLIKANNRPDGISTKMYETFLAELATKENLNVSTFDVFEENLPHYGQDLFDAFGKLQNNESLTQQETNALEAQQKSQAALKEADILVFAFPLWNLTIPSALQAFLDYNLQSGFTFKYNEQGEKEFLLGDKKVILLNARGGNYSSAEMNDMEMCVNYLHMIMENFFGMTIIDEVIIEGHAQDPEQANQFIETGLEKVIKVAANI